jgi:hypothetical protein
MKALTVARYTEKYQDQADVPRGICLHEITAADCALPKRPRVSHKYSYGRALILAGARGYAGAPALAANACERGGAGLTQLMVPESIYPIAASRCDGAVVLPLPAAEDGGFAALAARQAEDALSKANAVLIGPGLGTGAQAQALVKTVVQKAACPLIVDADGLRVFADEPALLDACRVPLILTPHEGEFKRLDGDLAHGRLAGALRFTADWTAFPQSILKRMLRMHIPIRPSQNICRRRAMNACWSAALTKTAQSPRRQRARRTPVQRSAFSAVHLRAGSRSASWRRSVPS